MSRSGKWHESVGAVHLHSDFSDGALPIPEIADIAAEMDIDFLMFSDHNTLEPKRRGLECWHGNILVLIGCEINDPDDRNHYLAFQIDREIERGLSAYTYVRQVHEAGGFGVIAHPSERRSFSDAYPPYPWTAWDTADFDGIEIWNQLSEWIEGVTRANIAWRILHPLRSIRFPVWETLERWDSLNRIRRVVGIGGIDVHAHRIRILGLFPVQIYPYKVQFRSIRTHVLTEKPIRGLTGEVLPFPEAEDQIFRALRAGHCFIVNRALGDGRGFQFRVESGAGIRIMGDRIPNGSLHTFHAEVPRPGRIRLLRNGQVIQTENGDRLIHETRLPGVYRIEVLRRKRGWIYSNPIVIE
ncbi:MAG TPA: histidinol-phosphatase [bacterium]|nr:histidinol-phosphatase [bacterium]